MESLNNLIEAYCSIIHQWGADYYGLVFTLSLVIFIPTALAIIKTRKIRVDEFYAMLTFFGAFISALVWPMILFLLPIAMSGLLVYWIVYAMIKASDYILR